jgi:hypothetical protein
MESLELYALWDTTVLLVLRTLLLVKLDIINQILRKLLLVIVSYVLMVTSATSLVLRPTQTHALPSITVHPKTKLCLAPLATIVMEETTHLSTA